MIIHVILIIFKNFQDMGQITEQLQMIQLYCFRYAVDNSSGFRTIDTIHQLPCMFIQTEVTEHSFCCAIIKRNFPVLQERFQHLFLIDTAMNSFQCFSFKKPPANHTFLPMKIKPPPEFLLSSAFSSLSVTEQIINYPNDKCLRSALVPHMQRYPLRYFVPLSEKLLTLPKNTALQVPSVSQKGYPIFRKTPITFIVASAI